LGANQPRKLGANRPWELVNRNSKISNIWQEFKSRAINADQLLNRCSRFNGPCIKMWNLSVIWQLVFALRWIIVAFELFTLQLNYLNWYCYFWNFHLKLFYFALLCTLFLRMILQLVRKNKLENSLRGSAKGI